MRIRDFGRSVRDHIATSWTLLGRNRATTEQDLESGTRLGRNRATTQQDLESGRRENWFSRLEATRREIMLRRAIRQETPPRPTYLLNDLHDPYSSFSPVEGVRVRVRRTDSSEFSHHQLTIRAQEEFTPPGSPTGTTLGIPAEHLLDENPEEMMGDIIQALPPNFDNPFVRPRRSLADSDESSGTRSDDSIQSSFPNVATPITQPGSPVGASPVRAATGAYLGGNPVNGPVVFVGGVYVTDGSNVMYTCRRCGGGTAHYTQDEWDHVLKMSRKMGN
ncbi:hypothetical protein H0G86_002101 [Trichoderma simmonsii]|uniref:Uncharacterized protein n=1 Tax=Trichoderma simmonsii TaxID=1491479 RepID=A0A8G0L2V4_9HYPO|nr:hypothetical protein H0G86_002101 [Trichoderma simmonsii]